MIVDGIQILFHRTGDTTDFSTFPAVPVTPSDGNEGTLAQRHFRNAKQDQTRLVWLNKIHHFICNSSDEENRVAKDELVDKLFTRCRTIAPSTIRLRSFAMNRSKTMFKMPFDGTRETHPIYRDFNHLPH